VDEECRVIASYGAEVKLIGDVWDSANAEAVRMASETKDALYIHPFAETDVRRRLRNIINVPTRMADGCVSLL
jgi:threonine dehydratase